MPTKLYGDMRFSSKLFGNKNKKDATESVDFEVSMSCGKCVQRVEDLMSKNKNVEDVKIDLQTKIVSLTYKKGKTDESILKKAIEGLGFDVTIK